MGRHVAVKELHLPDGLGAEDRQLFRERLLREARTAGRLNDPGDRHRVRRGQRRGRRPHRDGADRGPHAVRGGGASGPLSENAVIDVARRLLGALRAAHDSGVVHRDVKPSNVMLSPDGRVTLTDFGIAQAADDPRLTTTGRSSVRPATWRPSGSTAATPTRRRTCGAWAPRSVRRAGPRPVLPRHHRGHDRRGDHGEVPTTRTRGPLGAVIAGLLQRDPRARLGGCRPRRCCPACPHPADGHDRHRHAHGHRARPPRRRQTRRRWPARGGGGAGVGGGPGRGAAVAAERSARSSSPTGPAATSPRSTRCPPAACRASSPSDGSRPPPRPATTRTTSRCSVARPVRHPAGPALPRSGDGRRGAGPPARSSSTRAGRRTGQGSAAGGRPRAVGRGVRVPLLADSSFSTRTVLCVLYAADGTQLTGSRIAKPATTVSRHSYTQSHSPAPAASLFAGESRIRGRRVPHSAPGTRHPAPGTRHPAPGTGVSPRYRRAPVGDGVAGCLPCTATSSASSPI